jgi:hypothetical protein
LFDVNLRQDFFSAGVIQESLELATAAKLNRDELRRISQMLGVSSSRAPDEDAAVFEIVSRFGLDWVAVNDGSQGTTLFAQQQKFS